MKPPAHVSSIVGHFDVVDGQIRPTPPWSSMVSPGLVVKALTGKPWPAGTGRFHCRHVALLPWPKGRQFVTFEQCDCGRPGLDASGSIEGADTLS